MAALVRARSLAGRASQVGSLCGLRNAHLHELFRGDFEPDLTPKCLHGRRIEELRGLAGLVFQRVSLGQAGLKGLAVLGLLLGPVAAVASEVKSKDLDGDVDQGGGASLAALLLVVFFSGAVCSCMVLGSLWRWCRIHHVQAGATPEVVSRPGRPNGQPSSRPVQDDSSAERQTVAAAPVLPAAGAEPPAMEFRAVARAVQVASSGAAAPASPMVSTAEEAGYGPAATSCLRERGSRRQGCADTLAEELERYTVADLKAELRARQMLVGGLKEDLTRRLSRDAAGDATYKVACTIARRSGAVIPLGAFRSDESLAAWCQQQLQQQQL